MKKENGKPLWIEEEEPEKHLWKKDKTGSIIKSEPPSGNSLWKDKKGEVLNE